MKCEDCKKRKAIIMFSEEPLLSLTHGLAVKNICRQCYIKRIENEIKLFKENLKKQKNLIRTRRKVTRWKW